MSVIKVGCCIDVSYFSALGASSVFQQHIWILITAFTGIPYISRELAAH